MLHLWCFGLQSFDDSPNQQKKVYALAGYIVTPSFRCLTATRQNTAVWDHRSSTFPAYRPPAWVPVEVTRNKIGTFLVVVETSKSVTLIAPPFG